MEQNPTLPMDDGMYTVVYPSEEYRTLRFKTFKRGNLAGSQVVSYRDGHDWTILGFYTGNGRVAFWKRFSADNNEMRLARIQRAVSVVTNDPAKSGMAYALKSNRCCRCDLPLTVPASINQGMGPECAKKRARKQAA
jgi:hypothetical protein